MGLAITMALALVSVARWGFAGAETGRYRARPAILYALAYFIVVAAVAHSAGVLAWLLDSAMQLRPALWWWFSPPGVALIALAYAAIWPRGVFTDGRAAAPLWQALFGLVWGLAQGLMFLCIWRATGFLTALPGWQALLSFVLIASFNALWHALVWDVHVSPPHNLRAWNLRKVLFCHSPNLAFSLAHLAYFGDALYFVSLQMLALMLSSLAMRFPGWNSPYQGAAGEQR